MVRSPHRRVSVKSSMPTVRKAMATETCSSPCSMPRPPRIRLVDRVRTKHHRILMPFAAHSRPRVSAKVYARYVSALCASSTWADHSTIAHKRAFAKPITLRALAPLSIPLLFRTPVSCINALASTLISPPLKPIAPSALARRTWSTLAHVGCTRHFRFVPQLTQASTVSLACSCSRAPTISHAGTRP